MTRFVERIRSSVTVNEDTLISAIKKRAADPGSRADQGAGIVGPVATDDQIARAEQELGCKLHPLHCRLLQEVGNGGFGPGRGIIGVEGGCVDDQGRSALELRNQLFSSESDTCALPQVVPICDWGDGAWSCLDEDTGAMLLLDENGLLDSGLSLHELMSDWVSGVDLVERLFSFEERSGIDPFTKQPVTAQFRARGVGRVYRRMSE